MLTLTGADHRRELSNRLKSAVTYTNTSDDPSAATRTMTFLTTDATAGVSVAETRDITVAPVNDVPDVTTTVADLAYTENDGAIAIDTGLIVTDLDDTNLASATIQITNNYTTGEDVLAFSNQLGITGSFNATNGMLTLTGATTVANYQTALAHCDLHQHFR